MAKWWCNSATDAARLVRACVALAAVAAIGLSGCRREPQGPAASIDESAGPSIEALPAPTGTPGTSVTGMPTEPPVAVEAAPAAAPVPTPATPADAMTPPVDAPPVATATPVDVPKPAGPPPDTAAAAARVSDYMAALGSGAFPAAQQLWAGKPNDDAVQQLAHGNAFQASVGTPIAAADGSSMSVPVTVAGSVENGATRRIVATYTLQRSATGVWQITGATTREDAP